MWALLKDYWVVRRGHFFVQCGHSFGEGRLSTRSLSSEATFPGGGWVGIQKGVLNFRRVGP